MKFDDAELANELARANERQRVIARNRDRDQRLSVHSWYWSRVSIAILGWHVLIWSIVLALSVAMHPNNNWFMAARFLALVVAMELLTHFFSTFWKLLAATVCAHATILAGGAIWQVIADHSAHPSGVAIYWIVCLAVLYVGITPYGWPVLVWALTRRFCTPLAGTSPDEASSGS